MGGAQEHGDGSAAVSRRGRPRDEARRRAILEAAGDLMLEGGLGAATMEAIAARAGVSKQTIYNWWPSRAAVAFEGFMTRADPVATLPASSTVAETLQHLAVALVRLFTETPAGPLMRSLVADAQHQPEIAVALREQWLGPRRQFVVQAMQAGIASREFRHDLDVEAVVDLIFGPLYYRLLLGHGPLTEDFARRSVDHVVRGIRHEGVADP